MAKDKKPKVYKIIWVYARKIWGEEANTELHGLVWQNYRKRSLKELTWAQYYHLQDLLQKLANPGGATTKQLQVLRQIRSQLGGDSQRFAGLLKKQTGKTDVFALTKSEATKVITGFNKMKKSIGA